MTINELKMTLYPAVLSMLEYFDASDIQGESYISLAQRKPFDIGDFLDEIIFECIRRVQNMNAEVRSLRQHIISNTGHYSDSDRVKFSRAAKQASEDWNERVTHLYNRYGILPPEPAIHNIQSTEEKWAGHKLTYYQFRQLENLRSLTILKKIANSSIFDTKHYSSYHLERDVRQYEDYFEDKFSSATDDAEYINAAIEFADVESYFYIEFMYALAVALSQQNMDWPPDTLSLEIRRLCQAGLDTRFKTDSRFIINRRKLIPELFGPDWECFAMKVECFLAIKINLFHDLQLGSQQESLCTFFNNNISTSECAAFLHTTYNLQQFIAKKEWTAEHTRLFKALYDDVQKRRRRANLHNTQN